MPQALYLQVIEHNQFIPPAEVPERYEDAYDGKISNAQRKKFAGMLTCEDEDIGNVTPRDGDDG